MRSWWGEGVGSRIAFVVDVDIRPAYFHAVVAAVAGVTCSVLLFGSRLVDTVPWHWGPLSFRVPCRVPFAENIGCLVAEILPAVGILSIAGGWAAVSAIAVLVPLGLPAIDAGGAMVVHSCSCYGSVPLYDVLASARGVVVESTSR